MLYVFKYGEALKKREYISEGTDPTQRRAYGYVTSLSDAKLFNTVTQAISWLERAAYQNGQRSACYNGCLHLVQVEAIPVKPVKTEYKEIGLVE